MKALYKGVGTPLQNVEISNELAILQQYVGGYIEVVDLSPTSALVINEEGVLRGMEPNFYFHEIKDYIVGPALFVGTDGDEFCDISKEEADHIRSCFEKEVSNG